MRGLARWSAIGAALTLAVATVAGAETLAPAGDLAVDVTPPIEVVQAPDAAPVVADLAARQIEVGPTEAHPAYTVFAPAGRAVARRALLTLHGMGGNGPEIASTILERAQAQGWVVVAPTIRYGDWTDPIALAAEELRLQPQLAAILDHVEEESGVAVTGKALVFGFSRGAQAAMRFAIFYPDHVEAVAAFSAGTYTLPVAQAAMMSVRRQETTGRGTCRVSGTRTSGSRGSSGRRTTARRWRGWTSRRG